MTYRAELYDADGVLLGSVHLDYPTFGEAYANLANFLLSDYTQHNGSPVVQRITLEPA